MEISYEPAPGELQPTRRFHCSKEAGDALADVVTFVNGSIAAKDPKSIKAFRSDPWNFGQLLAKARKWLLEREQGARLDVDVFEPFCLRTRDGREWRRICTLKQLHQLGLAMGNCLLGTYDNEFLKREREFWFLAETDSGRESALAAVGLALGKPLRVFDAESSNVQNRRTPIPPKFSWDFRELLAYRRAWGTFSEETGKDERGKLAHLGIFGLIDWEIDEPEFVIAAEPPIRAWRLGNPRGLFLYLHQPGRGLAEICLNDAQSKEASLANLRPVLAADRLDGKEPGLSWLGRGLSNLFEQRPRIDVTRILSNLPDFIHGVWWRDAVQTHCKVVVHRRPMADPYKTFFFTEAGVTLTDPVHEGDEQSPIWLVDRDENGHWRNCGLLPEHSEVLQNGEFWKILDPEANLTGFLARMWPDHAGKPKGSWAPIHEEGVGLRWAAPSHGWFAPREFLLPGQDGFRLRAREVLDWETAVWKPGSGHHVARGHFPVAWQVVAFAEGKKRSLCGALLRRKTPKQERYTLLIDAQGAYPAILASLVTAVEAWCPTGRIDLEWRNPHLEIIAARDSAGNSAVAFDHGCPKIDNPPAGLSGSGWRQTAEHVFGYDESGRLLWLAPVSGTEFSPCLCKPIGVDGFLDHTAEAHALSVIRQGHFRCSKEWRSIVLRQGSWWSADGTVSKTEAGDYTALSCGGSDALLVPSEPGVLRWRIWTSVFVCTVNEEEKEEGIQTVAIGYLQLDHDGHASLTLDEKWSSLQISHQEERDADFETTSKDFIPFQSADDLRNLVAAVLARFGAKPKTLDLAWLSLCARNGCLVHDDFGEASLAGKVVPVIDADLINAADEDDCTWEMECKDRWAFSFGAGIWDGYELTINTKSLSSLSGSAIISALLSASRVTNDGIPLKVNRDAS